MVHYHMNPDTSARKRLPRFLYHGTPSKNVESICEYGLRRGTPETCGVESIRGGFDKDCIGNVSLAVHEKDAFFFALAQGDKKDFEKPQAVVKVDTSKFDTTTCIGGYRLFENENGEVWCKDMDIPPTAVSRIHLRQLKNHKLVHQYRTCDTTKCKVCGRYIRKRDPRRSLGGNPSKYYHGHAGAIHDVERD